MFPKEYPLIAFVALVVVYFILKFFTERAMNRKSEKAETSAPARGNAQARQTHTAEDCAEGGCGMRAICSGKEEVVFDYYEDEELDRFKGRKADEYADADAAEFREVLTTLRTTEVAPWLNSLCARGIAVPAQIRDEAIALAKQNK